LPPRLRAGSAKYPTISTEPAHHANARSRILRPLAPDSVWKTRTCAPTNLPHRAFLLRPLAQLCTPGALAHHLQFQRCSDGYPPPLGNGQRDGPGGPFVDPCIPPKRSNISPYTRASQPATAAGGRQFSVSGSRDFHVAVGGKGRLRRSRPRAPCMTIRFVSALNSDTCSPSRVVAMRLHDLVALHPCTLTMGPLHPVFIAPAVPEAQRPAFRVRLSTRKPAP